MSTNLAEVGKDIQTRLKSALDPETLLRPVVLDMIVLIHKRIHVDGIGSNGDQIGTYSKGYLAVRSGVFGNTHVITKGANKGKTKGSGTFTSAASENKVGKARPNYNRGSDPKVIISLTRKLENSYTAVAAGEKGYGISFLDQEDYNKSQWVEETYDKPIFKLTAEEEKIAVQQITDLLTKALA